MRRNTRAVSHRAGVPLLAVIKSDAYGLGAMQVAEAIADQVGGFCVFSLAEAAAARIWEKTGKESLVLGPDPGVEAEQYLAQHARPAVWTVERAAALKSARPVLSVDTGMQRFACPAADIDAVLKAGGCDEAFTHALRRGQVQRLLELVGGRGLRLHAAGSALLDEPLARLDAVRPGLALYQGAVRVSTRLIDVRDTAGPAGYSSFSADRHGIILAGYANGLRRGPCLVNGRRCRVIEVGMQSAFVAAAQGDKIGDEVVLLGDELAETEVAEAWGTSAQEVLVRMCGMGKRGW